MTVQPAQTLDLTLRPATADDAQICGQICYAAFSAIASQHNFPVDFPSAEAGVGLVSYLIAHPGFYGVVAERGGQVVGSNFLDERSSIVAVGPITVDPTIQDRGIGRRLMEHVLERATTRGFAGVRLVQSAYHTRSLSLYTRLGFQVREPLACMQGPPIGIALPGRTVRPAQEADLEHCNRICQAIHGHTRANDVQDAIGAGTATVVEYAGRITGYATSLAFFGHAVGETDDDLKALIGAAAAFGGTGILVPARSPLFRWCLDHKLRTVQVMTLMSRGLYNEPRGAFLPSILF
jgi:predicted N-acetyltransferase YhbS